MNLYVYDADHGIIGTSGSVEAENIAEAISIITTRYERYVHEVYISVRNFRSSDDFANRVKIK